MSKKITMTVTGAKVTMIVQPAKMIEKNVEKYTGSYQATPSMQAQTLQTADKLMTEDVTIHEIPVYKTQNLSGGYTVIIGG